MKQELKERRFNNCGCWMLPKETGFYQRVPLWCWASHTHASVGFSSFLCLVALIWHWRLTKYNVIMQRLLS